jgi:hypothetical protein
MNDEFRNSDYRVSFHTKKQRNKGNYIDESNNDSSDYRIFGLTASVSRKEAKEQRCKGK